VLTEAAERFGFISSYKGIKPLKVPKTDIKPFRPDEINLILQNCREDFRDYLLIRFFTGMRTGEVDGLKWKYVDFESRKIKIRETIVEGETNYTKNDFSQRDIQMSQPVYEAFLRMKLRTSNHVYVFINQEGNPLSHNSVTKRVWYPLLRSINLEKRNPYQMRHTAATLWLESGESPEWIANQMGHANTEMLFRVYSRYVPNLTRQDGSAANRMFSTVIGDVN
jgi:integrase